MRRLKLAWFVLILLSASGNAWGQVQYTVTDLGTLGGGGSHAYGINNSGQVAGADFGGNPLEAPSFTATGPCKTSARSADRPVTA